MNERQLTVAQAYRVLGLNGPVTPSELSAAFRKVAKAVHPDSPRGDVILFRYVLDAYHLLQQQPPSRPLLQAPASGLRVVRPPAEVVITPLQALKGGIASTYIRDRQYRLRLAPGLRHGDRLRLKNVGTVPVRIKPAQGLSVFGDDLFFQTAVDAQYLRDGGRIEVLTPLGPQTVWLVPDMESPVRLCLDGLGLPARGSYKTGDLIISLTARQSPLSEAEYRRERFTEVWTARATAA
ncbi:J domain-containing protein [uncultured Brevundimonas sp.]|uniref:J domain-containing protein n=1 Tax=uncultured Brevundimonas sp. TaxID=213418 RepID=UPI00260AD600|nr:J domain-containing protein [uncultured Brevundimonas sp.]